MIAESQQEQAALYALGLLDADEAGAFERQIDAEAALRELTRDLQETAAQLALASDESVSAAPAALRERVLAAAKAGRAGQQNSAGRRAGPARSFAWLPWALAALLMGSSAVLLWRQQSQTRKLHFVAAELTRARAEPSPAPETLAQVSLCALEPTPDFVTAQPRAAVLWDAAHREGKLRVNRLAPPAEGKDYQLWTVEEGRKEPVSAGVVHVGADGTADVSFQPVEADGKPVVAVAISLERAGGAPTNEGPILLLGKF